MYFLLNVFPFIVFLFHFLYFSVILLHVSSFLESIIAAVLALLVVDPKGKQSVLQEKLQRNSQLTIYKLISKNLV